MTRHPQKIVVAIKKDDFERVKITFVRFVRRVVGKRASKFVNLLNVGLCKTYTLIHVFKKYTRNNLTHFIHSVLQNLSDIFEGDSTGHG